MKKLLYQKFITDTLKIFTLISLSIALIVWVIQAVNFLDFVTEDGHGFRVYFSYSLLNLPKILHRVLPFAFFVSLFYQIYKYEERNELLIFWTNGVKKINFINILLLYSILIVGFQIVLSAFVSPMGQNKARNFLRNSNIDFLPALVKEGKFIDTVSKLTIFIESKDELGNYKNIFLNDDTGEYKDCTATIKDCTKTQTIYAKRGRLINEANNRYFELYDGRIINNDKDRSTNISFKKIDFNLSKYTSKSTTYSKIQEIENTLLYNCFNSYYGKSKKKFTSRKLTCEQSTIKSVQQELLKRFYQPIYLPLLALICCLLIMKSKESSEYNKYKFLIFSLAFIVIIISEITLRYSSYNKIGFLFFLSFPILFFFLIYIPLIIKFKHRV